MDIEGGLEIEIPQIFIPKPLRLYNSRAGNSSDSSRSSRVIHKIDLSEVNTGESVQLKTACLEVTFSSVAHLETSLPIKRPAAKSPGPQKTSCNCLKSKCLKLYCECFAAGSFCLNCNCAECFNQTDNELRTLAVQNIQQRNPFAFKRKAKKIAGIENKSYKGCNCSKSQCQKKYCECFGIGIECGSHCRCVGCKNK